MISLKDMGFDQYFLSQLDDFELESPRIARVAAVHRGTIEVFNQERSFTCIVNQEPFPTVGDFVLTTDQHTKGSIQVEKIYQRKSALRRKVAGRRVDEQLIAANVDYGLIVSSANDELKLSRVERYLLALKEAEIEPILILSKTDLCEEVDHTLKNLQQVAPDLTAIALCSIQDQGIDQVQKILVPGKTSVVVGSSGVGKSTLINSLCGEDLQKTSEISFFDKGSHTTTSRQMLKTKSGVWIIDTPGMREFQPLVSRDAIADTFTEIEDYLGSCLYRNCSHTVEEGCKILEALAAGELDHRRWKNYQKLLREQERLNTKKTVNSKARWKDIHKKKNKAQRKKVPY